ncbi:NAD(P)-binding protein [Tothia fuscella]|uniref:NAD(P)-binding protein n=1 Tax=Tothia fuscella TaxID=1048955 RepID=A0A9P4TVC1_9PEZI|nr:NAD(P)-binding protein [Tothia fuscella]
MSEYHQKVPESFLLFGVSGRVGDAAARAVSKQAPKAKLRLASTKPEKAEKLKKKWPNAEVVVANYEDLPSLDAAFKDIEAIFIITQFGLDEKLAMTNVVTAAKRSANKLLVMIRFTAIFPEFSLNRLPKSLQGSEHGPAFISQPIGKAIMDESLLPVIYLNAGATFIENYKDHAKPIREAGKMIWPSRRVPFILVEDIGEIIANIILSGDVRHFGAFHTMNNGQDRLDLFEAAEIISQVIGKKIEVVASKEAYFKVYTSFMGEAMANRLWEFFQYEKDHEVIWALNDFAERTLGRKPKTLKAWVEENKELFVSGNSQVEGGLVANLKRS